MADRAFRVREPENSRLFWGIAPELCEDIWNKTLAKCAGATDERAFRAAEKRAVLVGSVRFLYLLTAMGLGSAALHEKRIGHTVALLETLAGEIDDLAGGA